MPPPPATITPLPTTSTCCTVMFSYRRRTLQRSPTNAANLLSSPERDDDDEDADGGGQVSARTRMQRAIKRRETQHTFKALEVHDEEKGEIRVNQYTLTECLGRGAYGQVYRTVDNTTGWLVGWFVVVVVVAVGPARCGCLRRLNRTSGKALRAAKGLRC